jgi:hypothetical protein
MTDFPYAVPDGPVPDRNQRILTIRHNLDCWTPDVFAYDIHGNDITRQALSIASALDENSTMAVVKSGCAKVVVRAPEKEGTQSS